MMASLRDRMFHMAFEALLNRDSELCDHAVAEDEEIDILEKQVDQEGVNLLLRFHLLAAFSFFPDVSVGSRLPRLLAIPVRLERTWFAGIVARSRVVARS